MDASHKSGGATKTSAASGQVLAMRPQGLAYNAAKDDGFTCSACDHTVPFASETEWSRVSLQQYLALMSA